MSAEIAVIEREVSDVLAQAPAFERIETAHDAEFVGGFLTNVRIFRKRVEEFFKPDIDAAHKLHKSLLAKMKQVDERPARAEEVCRRMIAEWSEREAARIRAEQARLDAEAVAKAAKDALKDGDSKLAADIKAGKVAVMATTVAAPSAKVEGVSTRESWRAEVADKLTFVKAVAAGKHPLDWLDINIGQISRVMQATKGQLQVAGIRAVKDTVVVHKVA